MEEEISQSQRQGGQKTGELYILTIVADFSTSFHRYVNIIYHFIMNNTKFCFLSRGSLCLSNLRVNLCPRHFNLSPVKESPAPVRISPAMRKQRHRYQQPVLDQSGLRVGSSLMVPRNFLSSVSTSCRVTPPNGMCRRCLSLSALCPVSVHLDRKISYLFVHQLASLRRRSLQLSRTP